jgi:hypothetical protein
MPPDVPTEHITDEYMKDRLAQAKSYTLVVLRPTPETAAPSSGPIIWEHGRRNMALQAAGIMPIVCPVGDPDIAGIGIFTLGAEEVRAIMTDDPGVRAGLFIVELHTCRGFPGSALS